MQDETHDDVLQRSEWIEAVTRLQHGWDRYIKAEEITLAMQMRRSGMEWRAIAHDLTNRRWAQGGQPPQPLARHHRDTLEGGSEYDASDDEEPIAFYYQQDDLDDNDDKDNDDDTVDFDEWKKKNLKNDRLDVVGHDHDDDAIRCDRCGEWTPAEMASACAACRATLCRRCSRNHNCMTHMDGDDDDGDGTDYEGNNDGPTRGGYDDDDDPAVGVLDDEERQRQQLTGRLSDTRRNTEGDDSRDDDNGTTDDGEALRCHICNNPLDDETWCNQCRRPIHRMCARLCRWCSGVLCLHCLNRHICIRAPPPLPDGPPPPSRTQVPADLPPPVADQDSSQLRGGAKSDGCHDKDDNLDELYEQYWRTSEERLCRIDDDDNDDRKEDDDYDAWMEWMIDQDQQQLRALEESGNQIIKNDEPPSPVLDMGDSENEYDTQARHYRPAETDSNPDDCDSQPYRRLVIDEMMTNDHLNDKQNDPLDTEREGMIQEDQRQLRQREHEELLTLTRAVKGNDDDDSNTSDTSDQDQTPPATQRSPKRQRRRQRTTDDDEDTCSPTEPIDMTHSYLMQIDLFINGGTRTTDSGTTMSYYDTNGNNWTTEWDDYDDDEQLISTTDPTLPPTDDIPDLEAGDKDDLDWLSTNRDTTGMVDDSCVEDLNQRNSETDHDCDGPTENRGDEAPQKTDKDIDSGDDDDMVTEITTALAMLTAKVSQLTAENIPTCRSVGTQTDITMTDEKTTAYDTDTETTNFQYHREERQDGRH
jgi:hypothetical protein